MALSDEQRAVLDFEIAYPVWKYQGARESAVREKLGLSFTRYSQVLNALLDAPAAEAYDGPTIHRLRRLRAARRRQRRAQG